MATETTTEANIDHMIDALHSVRFIRKHYGSSPDGANLIKEIVKALRDTKKRSYVALADTIMVSITAEPAGDKS